MSRLPPLAPVATVAGVVMIPDSIDVYAPPTVADLRQLHAYLHDARVPMEVWNAVAGMIGVEKVSEIKSIDGLLAAWLHVLRWQWKTSGAFCSCSSSWAIACGRAVIHEPKIAKAPELDLSLFELTL